LQIDTENKLANACKMVRLDDRWVTAADCWQ